ncbi:MAG TPA: gliding motility-associated C-terminal domain-containing protein, partial [Saprospiraceae bacterium]|nr:gliding motility-associated C-terminal domain-containing protein [Saprospiraceae bacterium]
NAPGKYTLKLINTTNGCDNSFTVDVKQDIDKPLADAGNTVLLTCKETDLTLNGNGSSTGADFIYDWTTKNGFIVTGKTGLTPTVNQPGWYYILVKDKTNGCTNLDSVLVNQDIVKPIAAAASPELLTCAVSVVPVSATGSSTGSTFSYDWSTVSGSIQGTNNGFTVNATSIGSYTVTVTNSTNGCTQTATVVVNEDKEKPVAKAGTDLILNCQQTTQLLDGSGSSVGPEFTYLWTTLDGNIISGANTLNPTIDQAGTYTLTVTSSKNGCSSSDDVKISLSEDFPVAVVVDPEVITCVKLSVLINGLGSSTGPEFTYQWSTTTGNIVAGANSSTPEVDKAGVYLFTITNVANGCVTNKNVTVKEDKVKPKAVAGPDFEAGCFDVPEALDGTASSGKGTLTYNWTTTNGNIVSGENTATPLIQKAGIYSLLITDNSNGCTATDNIEVTSNALEDVTFTLKIPSCFGEYGTAQIVNVKGGLPPYKYSINGGQSYTGNAVFNKLNPGLYNLLVKDGYDCIIARSFEIPAKTDIQVLVEPKVELYLGESYTLKAQVNIPKNLIAKVEWFSKDGLERPDSLVTKVNVLQTTEYIVRVTDISGCTGQARVLVVIADPEIYVPNAFSPYDLNGNNDLAMVFGRPSGIKKITKFQIFNRWGESMYESSDFLPNDPNHGWNGLHRGKKLDPAVFVWWLEVEYINGKKKVYKGDINLLR